MKSSLSITALTLICILSLSVSCKKKSDDCVAGAGGDNTMVVYFKHHSKLITAQPGYPDTLFIKYNTKDFPGDNPSAYNAIYTGDTLTDHFLIDNLKCGDYYLFGTGWDPAISQRVKGGIPVSITDHSGQTAINVPVTED